MVADAILFFWSWGHRRLEKGLIFTVCKIGKKSSVQGLSFCPATGTCPPTGTSPNWHFPQVALPPTGTSPNWHFPQLALFWTFCCAIENLSPLSAGTPEKLFCFCLFRVEKMRVLFCTRLDKPRSRAPDAYDMQHICPQRNRVKWLNALFYFRILKDNQVANQQVNKDSPRHLLFYTSLTELCLN